MARLDGTFGPLIHKKDNGDTMVIEEGGSILVASGIGAAAGTNVSAVESMPIPHKTVLTFAALSVTMTDATTAGCHGTQKIYDFPAGSILIAGCVSDLQITAGAGGITDTAAVVGSIGTVAVGTNNATLTTTEANIMPSTAAALTAGAGNCDSQLAVPIILDGTTTPVDAILNFAVPDADSSANDTLLVSGTVTITWFNLGDH